MKHIYHLIILAVGFFLGIFVGIHNPGEAAKLDQIRADEQAKLQPRIEAAVHQAKVDVLQQVVNDPQANSAQPAGNGGNQFGNMVNAASNALQNGGWKSKYQDMLNQEKAKLTGTPANTNTGGN